MKKVVVVVTLCLVFLGCQPKVEKESVTLLTGYWEIEKVVFEEGEDKEYPSNDSFDYFEIKGDTGFRKKVMPQLDGTFQANDLVETIRIREKDDQIFLGSLKVVPTNSLRGSPWRGVSKNCSKW